MPCEESGHLFVADKFAAISPRATFKDGGACFGVERLRWLMLRCECQQKFCGQILIHLRQSSDSRYGLFEQLGHAIKLS